MKKNLSFLLFAFALSGFIIGSCSKDDNNTTNQSRKEILLAKKWKITSITINGIDVTNDFLEDCSKDDYAVFKTDGTIDLYEGATKCDPTDPEFVTGTWSLSTDEKTLTILSESYTIISLSSTSMQVSQEFGGETIISNYVGF